VLASIPPVAVDTESWMLLLWQMQEQRHQSRLTGSSGGKAILDAVQKVTPDQVLKLDVWHVLHKCQKVQGRVNRAVQELHEQIPKVARQAKRVEAGQKPLGRNPKTDPLAHAKDVQQMEYVASSLCYLTCELKRLLGIVMLKDQGILGSKERQKELDTLMDLFSEVYEITPKPLKEEVKKLVRHIQLALPGLVGFCQELDCVQQQALDQLGEAAVSLIGWAWQRRAILQPQTDKLVADFPADWQTHAAALLTAWDQAVRSSSAVENWHSVLRPFIAVHRSLSADLLALLAVWHNHRVASCGLYQGQSPLMRAGLAKEPTDWLLALGYPSPSAGQAPTSSGSCQLQIESIAA